MRILFFATYPTCATGYGRIGNILSNYLAKEGHDVFYLGISNFEYCSTERYIHPSITLLDALKKRKPDSPELYGIDCIVDTIAETKPEVVFIYNDIIVVNRILNEFIETNISKNFKLIIYLDLVYEYEKLILFKNINIWADELFLFSNCWKNNLIKIGFKEDKLFVVPHGIDTTIFKPVYQPFAKQMIGFKEDDFIILNTNRNCYRKAIDITVEAFIKFLKKYEYDDKIKLFLNMDSPAEHGYNILDLIKVMSMKNDADFDKIIAKHIFTKNSMKYFSDEKLNELYNACDVGINTCVGEGFGLCNLEHACVGKPQIVSKVGALADIFDNSYSTLIEPKIDLYLSNNMEEHVGFIQLCDSNDFANAIEKYYLDRTLGKEHGDLAMHTLVEKYNWSKILSSMNERITRF